MTNRGSRTRLSLACATWVGVAATFVVAPARATSDAEIQALQPHLWALGIGSSICFFEEGSAGEALGMTAVRIAIERNIEVDEVFGFSTPDGQKFARAIDAETASVGEQVVCDRIWAEYGPDGSKRANHFAKAAP